MSVFQNPGPDTSRPPLSALIDMVLATVGADRAVTPDEQAEVQRLMVGLQAIAEQQVMGAAPMGPGDATEPAFAAEGAEYVEPQDDGMGTMPAGAGY